MPRKPRVHVPGGIYHVILRGNHQEALFHRRSDRSYLNVLVGDVAARFHLQILAYCWMTNHLHLAVRVGETPLGKPMQRLAMRYSRHQHLRADQIGHLFERRHKALLVDRDAYLLTLVRYIHLNPVDAGLVASPTAYPWSSHRDYLGRPTVPWLEASLVLKMFGPSRRLARSRYRRFMQEPVDSAAELLRERQESASHGEVLLEELAKRYCSRTGIPVAHLRSPSRSRRLNQARVAFALDTMAAGLATLSALARYLGRSPSALRQSIDRAGYQAPGN